MSELGYRDKRALIGLGQGGQYSMTKTRWGGHLKMLPFDMMGRRE